MAWLKTAAERVLWIFIALNVGARGRKSMPLLTIQCMSPKSAQRFWDNDMHQDKGLKRGA
ncbi:MAG: hypothetical protein EOQ40_29930 [Mesorhizobium sp.]|uniref:hypothetical protein n=1 Tax=Mesorhizobium sp. TaxID=1871066 RepID=UPI000FE575FB|nr:hypothetical protein [Mesorhizobium sp.]RWB14722.1 MAG: hypothetical protein EOQ40_29930 [Mesorhizobium sp.]